MKKKITISSYIMIFKIHLYFTMLCIITTVGDCLLQYIKHILSLLFLHHLKNDCVHKPLPQTDLQHKPLLNDLQNSAPHLLNTSIFFVGAQDTAEDSCLPLLFSFCEITSKTLNIDVCEPTHSSCSLRLSQDPSWWYILSLGKRGHIHSLTNFGFSVEAKR